MGVDMTGYSIFVRPDLLQVFWTGMQAGEFITDAVLPIETSRRTGRRVLLEAGGVRPRRGRDLKGRCLSFTQREEIAVLRAQGHSLRQIGAVIGVSASTVSRELRRNTLPGTGYRATSAQVLAYQRASRPKPAKLHTNQVLRAKVEADLRKKYSPEQISGRLRRQFPDELEMQVSPETIYQSLYVQSRGALKRDLTACLRTGRAVRRPCRKAGQRKNRVPDMINISERPKKSGTATLPSRCPGSRSSTAAMKPNAASVTRQELKSPSQGRR